MKKLTVGSLFAGIGGLELGLEWTGGFETVWQVEIDDYANRVLAKHWPNVFQWPDVRTFPPGDGHDRYGEFAVDLICGGFPCQDISLAGVNAGIREGTRSGLWFEFARIVRTLRPRYVLVENVAALLGRGMGIVLRDMAESGYDAEWDCLPAAAFGAPHIRERVFILAHHDGHEQGRGGVEKRQAKERIAFGRSRPPFADVERMGRTAWCGEPGYEEAAEEWRREYPGGHQAIADTGRAGLSDAESERQTRGPVTESNWWSIEPDVVRMVHGVPSRMDRIRCLGNAVVPQVAQWIGERILEAHKPPSTHSWANPVEVVTGKGETG